MSGSVNRVALLGNVGADPEIRSTRDGKRIANLRLATSESWKDKSGQKQEKTEWHTVVVFSEGLTDVIERYVSKGSKIYVEGSLQTRQWEDQQGQKRYSTEVVLKAFGGTLVLLDGRPSGERDTSPRGSGGGGTSYDASEPYSDDIPFGPCVL